MSFVTKYDLPYYRVKNSKRIHSSTLKNYIMKNHILLIVAFIVLLSTSIFAQYDRNDFNKNAFHKNITLELAGSHILWGLNYDMRLQRGRNDGFGFKVGVGGAQINLESDDSSLGVSYISVPLEFNHVLGKRRHGLVTGIGVLSGYGNLEGMSPDTNIDIKGIGVIGAYANVGYRFQPINSGFTFQVNVNPFFRLRAPGILPYAGISFGYGFK